eukprot:scaffold1_cov402-Prasinococcus_capsulatus_cf.AAC.68
MSLRCGGRDADGAPVIVMRPRYENTKSHEGNIKHLVYHLEHTANLLQSERSPVEKFTWVIDMKVYPCLWCMQTSDLPAWPSHDKPVLWTRRAILVATLRRGRRQWRPYLCCRTTIPSALARSVTRGPRRSGDIRGDGWN